MRTYQEKKLVPLLSSADINAGVDSDSIDMTACPHVCFVLVFGPSYAGAAGAIVKLYEGATHAAKTTAKTFTYTYTGAAIKSASADVLETEATSAALQIATATLLSRMLLIEFDAAEMADGMRYLTLEIGAEADAGQLSIVAIMDPAFRSPALDTVIA